MADSFTPIMAQPEPEEIDCSQVDVQQIEEMGMELAQNVKDYVVNVDITNI